MDRKCKAVIEKLPITIEGFNYNVQLWFDFHDSFVYAGYGKYFQTLTEAEQYAAEHSNAGIKRDFQEDM